MEQIVKLDNNEEYNQTEINQEDNEIIPDEIIFISQINKDVSFGDIFIFRLILCVLLILAIVIINITNSENTQTVVESFKNEVDKVFDYKQELNNLVASIFRFFNVEA